MKLAAMISDVLPSLFERPVTIRYPFELREPPDRLRACLCWDAQKCTGCGLCSMDCPAGAIEMHVLDKKNKRFVFVFHAERCTFCAQCTFTCRQGCLEMSSEAWELATLKKDELTIYLGEDEDVHYVLAGTAVGDAETS